MESCNENNKASGPLNEASQQGTGMDKLPSVSASTSQQLIHNLEMLRDALHELALAVSDFQFDHDAAQRLATQQQVEQMLSALRRSQ